MNASIINRIFLCLLFFLPFSIIIGNTVSLGIVILISFFFIFFSFYKNNWKWIEDPYLKLLVLLYAYLIFNSFISVDYSLGIKRNLGFLRYIFFIFAIKYFFPNNLNFKKILNIWMIIMIIVCLDIFYEFITLENILGFQSKYGRRIVSFFKDEAIVGTYLYAFLFIILGFLFNEKYRKKYFFLKYLIPLIIFISIILSGERSVAIRSFVGVMLFYLLVDELNFKKKILIFLLVIFSSVSIIYNSDYLKVRYYGQIVKYFFPDKEVYEKTVIEKNVYYHNKKKWGGNTHNVYFKHYSAAYEIFKKKPWFGVGNKNFGLMCFKDYDLTNVKGGCTTHPHQLYFELLSEHGSIGTIFFLAIFFIIFLKNIKSYFIYKNPIHLGSFIYLLTIFLPILPSGSFFGDFNSTFFWMNFGIMIAFEKNKNGGHDKN